jgi:hypothetical protein
MTGLQQIEGHRGAHMAKSDKAYFHEATLASIVDRPQPTADNTPVLKLGRTNSSILDGRQLPSRFL